ncbi:MAG: sigma-70 family RNA polymerase sigma factor [Candidatus Aenigmarchaeota archaeon]|nr:sigma-70 family RNA polymerase sigma factor [Candidatus Aenigmarchaeota archaeon]
MKVDNPDVNDYLKDIRRETVLDSQGNRDLAYVMRGQPHKCSEPRYRGLSPEQARGRMIAGNLALVVNIAKRYNNLGLDFGDLIGEGNDGLVWAARDYDPDFRNERDETSTFSTFAERRIKQRIQEALRKKPMVLIGKYVDTILPRWKRAYTELCNEQGFLPTPEEVVDRLNQTIDKEYEEAVVTGTKHRPKKNHVNPSVIPYVLSALHAKPAIKGVTYMGGLESPEDIKTSESAPRSEAALDVSRRENVEYLDRMKGVLSRRDERILELRFGYSGEGKPWNGEPKTLKEVSERVNLSRERVRQIEAEALKKLDEIFGDQVEPEKPKRSVVINVVAKFIPVQKPEEIREKTA